MLHADTRANARANAQANEPAGSSPLLRSLLFFRRWMANPLQMGSVVPSSPALGRRVATHARRIAQPDGAGSTPGHVVELGAGTGAITRALLAGGIAPARLSVVEIVPSMAEVLRTTYPGVHVACGDAWNLAPLLGSDLRGRVGAVVCGIPLVLLPRARQAALIAAIEQVAPGRGFLHYSYCVTSPLPMRALGLEGTRLAWTPLNFPPASVWHYRLRRGAATTAG